VAEAIKLLAAGDHVFKTAVKEIESYWRACYIYRYAEYAGFRFKLCDLSYVYK